MINLGALQKIRYAKSTVRFLDNLERGLRIRLEQEFKRTAAEVAKCYPDYKLALANHERRVERILTAFAGSTVEAVILRLRSFGLLKRPSSKAYRPELETKAKQKASKRPLTESELVDALTAKAQERWSTKLAPDISKRTTKQIGAIIEEGTAQGINPREIARQIVDEFDNISASRALTIARTESHSIAMETELDVIKEDGDITYKEWLSTNDDRTRPDHDHANGQKVKVNDKFTVGDSELDCPGDANGPPEQIINCRCVMVYSL